MSIDSPLGEGQKWRDDLNDSVGDRIIGFCCWVRKINKARMLLFLKSHMSLQKTKVLKRPLFMPVDIRKSVIPVCFFRNKFAVRWKNAGVLADFMNIGKRIDFTSTYIAI